MADVLTNAANLAGLVPTYYSKRLLERLVPNCRLYQLAEKRKIPANSGKTILWNRYVNLDMGIKLTEGTVPGPSAMSTETVSATLVQYGQLVKITDIVDETAISDVMKDTVDVLGDNAAYTVDMHIFSSIGLGLSYYGAADKLSAGAYSKGFVFLFAKTAGSLDGEVWGNTSTPGNASAWLNCNLTVSVVRKAVTRLRTLNVSPNEDGFYHGVTHPTMLDVLRGDATWSSWNQYTRPEKMERGLVGEVEGVKFYDDPNVVLDLSGGGDDAPWPSGAVSGVFSGGTVYPTFIFGRGAYCVTELEGAGTGENATQVYTVPRTAPDKADPLQQFGYVGYKATLAAQILNPSCGLVIGTTSM